MTYSPPELDLLRELSDAQIMLEIKMIDKSLERVDPYRDEKDYVCLHRERDLLAEELDRRGHEPKLKGGEVA